MITAVKAVVHSGAKPEMAFKLYNELKAAKTGGK